MLLVLAIACKGGEIESEVEGCPTVALDTESLTWTETTLGMEEVAVLTVSNTCDKGEDLEVDAVVGGGTGLSVAQEHYTIGAGDAASVVLHYTATAYKTQASELLLSTNDLAQPTLVVPLEGTADPDQDGDGYEAQQVDGDDCDDTDPNVNPGAEEVWNGKDDDCDGHTDNLGIEAVVVSWLDGGESSNLAYRGNLGTGDLDGDGAVELVLSDYSGAGRGYVVEGAEYGDFDDEAERYAEAWWSGSGYYGYYGLISRHMGDVTGDGTADLVVGGYDGSYYGGEVGLGVYAGGSELAGGLATGDAVVTLEGMTSSYLGGIDSGIDLDGDGVCEIYQGVYGASIDSYGNGALYVFDVAEHSGTISPADAAGLLYGEYYDYFGRQPAGGDFDGDGYGDLAVGASGNDDGANDGGAIYLFQGGSGALPTGPVEEAFDGKIVGDTAYAYLGSAPRVVVADLDGDGADSLVVGAPYIDQVYVHTSFSWVYRDLGDADLQIDGSVGPDYFGLGLAAGDFDGDGVAELAVGAPDSDSSSPSGSADKGMLFFYDLADAGSNLDIWDADGRIAGDERTSMFSQTLLAADLDGDGIDELVADAPGHSSGSRVYFIAPQ